MPLNHELLTILNQACADLDMPDINDIEDDLQTVVEDDNDWVLEFMMKMREKAQHSPHETDVEKLLRYFFRIRWAHIKDSPADYLRFKQSPANKRCVMLAEALAHQDEPIAKIVMPTLKNREYLAGGLMELTEEVDEAGQRRLAVNNTFLLMQNCSTLFLLKDWAEYQVNPGEPFYNHFYIENGKVVPLTKDEMTQIVDASPAHPLEFVDLMEYYQDLRRSQHTLYGVISRLIDQLRAAGQSLVQDPVARAQRDRVAGPEADTAVREFYQVWDAIPESDQKRALLALRAEPFDATMIATYGTREQYEAHVPSVEEYLSVLRHDVGLPCTERQILLTQRARFIHCVEVIAKGFEEIREANPRSFEQMITSDEDQDDEDDDRDVSFAEVKADYIAELDSYKDEIVRLDVDLPNQLLDHPASYRKFIQALQTLQQELDDTYLPKVENIDDLLFAFNFLIRGGARRLLNTCSAPMKNELLARHLEREVTAYVALAIDCNADLNTKLDGYDLLTVSLMNGWTDVVEALLKHNVHSIADAWKENSQTPLHYVFDSGELGMAAKIIANLKQHLTEPEFTQVFRRTNSSGETVIDIVVESLGVQGLKVLVDALGEDVFYYINNEGDSPLHVFVESNDVESLKYALSKSSADILQLLNAAEVMVLHLIASNGYQESLDCLMQHLGKGDLWDTLMLAKETLLQTPLHLAVAQGHLELVQKLLDFTSPDVARKIIVQNNLSASSCIQLALINDRLDIALILLKALAPNPFLCVPAHARAFDYALQQKKPEMILAILQSDLANALAPEKIDTALRLAMELEEPELAVALIRKNASLGVTFHQSTILHLALRRNWPEVLTALLERPDDLSGIMKMKNQHNRVALEVVHPGVPEDLRQVLETLVKRPQSSPPSSPNKKKKL